MRFVLGLIFAAMLLGGGPSFAVDDLRAEDLGAEDLGAEDLGAEDLGAEDLGAEDLRAEDLRAEDLRAEDLRAEDLRAEDLGPQVTSKRELTPEERAEKESRKACKIEICDIIATKDANGPNVSCDVKKTWRASQIAKMLGGRIDWPWGKAACQSKLKIERASLAQGHERPRARKCKCGSRP